MQSGGPASTSGPELTRPLESAEIFFTGLFIPVAAFSWIGILLAESGAFSGWRVLLGGSLLSAVALAGARRELRASSLKVARVARGRWLFLLLVAGLAALVFSRPGEYLIEGADASVYLASGRQIERTGAITSADPLLELMPPGLRSAFFVAGPTNRQEFALLPGGLPIGADGRVHPSFFHLFPVWVAIATAAFGSYGGYFVNVVLAVFGVIAVALIGRRLWSPAAGMVAAALLVVNFGQILLARLPSSEMLAQFMGLSAIFFTLLAWDHRARVAGACAGAAAGLAAFTRVDSLILIVIPAVAWLVLTRRGKSVGPAWSWYAAVLGVVSIHAAVHGATVAQVYVQRMVEDGLPRLWSVAMYLGVTTAIVLTLTVAAAGFLILKYKRRSLLWVGICAALALIVLPTPMIVLLNKLVTPVGLMAAVAGLGLVFAARWDQRILILVVPLLIQTALLMVWTVAVVLPGDSRRVIPLMLPAFTLLIGFLSTHVARRGTWLALGIWLLPIGLWAGFAWNAEPVVRAPLMRGVEAQVAAIASHIPPNALVVLDRSVPGHLPLALHYGFGRPSVRMADRPTGDGEIAQLITAAFGAQRPVFVAVASLPLVDLPPHRLWRRDFAKFHIEQEATLPLRYTVLPSVMKLFPREFRAVEIDVALYRVSARDREHGVPLPFVLDVGGDDFSALVDGFHAAEQMQSAMARWTDGDSRIGLPRLSSTPAGTMTLVLRLSADRAPGRVAAPVHIAVDGMPVGSITNVSIKLQEYRLTLPAEVQARLLAAPTIMSITSDAFTPKALGLNDDDRRLGLVLDWVRIE